jgi:hypothetical protein
VVVLTKERDIEVRITISPTRRALSSAIAEAFASAFLI